MCVAPLPPSRLSQGAQLRSSLDGAAAAPLLDARRAAAGVPSGGVTSTSASAQGPGGASGGAWWLQPPPSSAAAAVAGGAVRASLDRGAGAWFGLGRAWRGFPSAAGRRRYATTVARRVCRGMRRRSLPLHAHAPLAGGVPGEITSAYAAPPSARRAMPFAASMDEPSLYPTTTANRPPDHYSYPPSSGAHADGPAAAPYLTSMYHPDARPGTASPGQGLGGMRGDAHAWPYHPSDPRRPPSPPHPRPPAAAADYSPAAWAQRPPAAAAAAPPSEAHQQHWQERQQDGGHLLAPGPHTSYLLPGPSTSELAAAVAAARERAAAARAAAGGGGGAPDQVVPATSAAFGARAPLGRVAEEEAAGAGGREDDVGRAGGRAFPWGAKVGAEREGRGGGEWEGGRDAPAAGRADQRPQGAAPWEGPAGAGREEQQQQQRRQQQQQEDRGGAAHRTGLDVPFGTDRTLKVRRRRKAEETEGRGSLKAKTISGLGRGDAADCWCSGPARPSLCVHGEGGPSALLSLPKHAPLPRPRPLRCAANADADAARATWHATLRS